MTLQNVTNGFIYTTVVQGPPETDCHSPCPPSSGRNIYKRGKGKSVGCLPNISTGRHLTTRRHEKSKGKEENKCMGLRADTIRLRDRPSGVSIKYKLGGSASDGFISYSNVALSKLMAGCAHRLKSAKKRSAKGPTNRIHPAESSSKINAHSGPLAARQVQATTREGEGGAVIGGCKWDFPLA